MDSFTALADPTRRQIIEMLGCGQCAAGEIASAFTLSAPAISQHLKVLRETGLVRVQIDGQRRIYSLDPAGLAEMDDWIARVRRFWNERLDDLERELRSPQDGKPQDERNQS